MYNVLPYVKERYRVKRDNYTMYFYPMTEEGLSRLLSDIYRRRQQRFFNRKIYSKLLADYKEAGRYAKGFWTQAVCTMPSDESKKKAWDKLMCIKGKTLECSSAGDKRFSALYAKVKVFGIEDTIEGHYQGCKRLQDGSRTHKGQRPYSLDIYGIQLDIKYLTAYYKLLWYKYLCQHKELVEYACAFDNFTDKFRGKNTVNCQADVIKQFVKQGLKSIVNERDVVDLLKILAKKKEEESIYEEV